MTTAPATTTAATMAATTDAPRAGMWRPGRRYATLVLALVAVVVVTWAIVTFTGGDGDISVDPASPDARRAATVAQGVVSGRVVHVARDREDGKWEITIAQDGREYEVELAAGSLGLLRLDYE
jgi:zona occludens toxin (predicted ATPase)